MSPFKRWSANVVGAAVGIVVLFEASVIVENAYFLFGQFLAAMLGR